MNKNINLTKILANCPEGWEFWSDNYGKVQFKCISKSYIFVKRSDGYPTSYTKEGWFSKNFPASCLLWPSKNCRDWSKFSAPWYKKEKFDPNTLKPFDRVIVKDIYSEWKIDIYSHKKNNKDFPYNCMTSFYRYCIPYNDDTKHLVGTTNDAPEYYRYWED